MFLGNVLRWFLKACNVLLFTISNVSLFHIGIERCENKFLFLDLIVKGISRRSGCEFLSCLFNGALLNMWVLSEDTSPCTVLNKKMRSLYARLYSSVCSSKKESLSAKGRGSSWALLNILRVKHLSTFSRSSQLPMVGGFQISVALSSKGSTYTVKDFLRKSRSLHLKHHLKLESQNSSFESQNSSFESQNSSFESQNSSFECRGQSDVIVIPSRLLWPIVTPLLEVENDFWNRFRNPLVIFFKNGTVVLLFPDVIWEVSRNSLIKVSPDFA